MADAGHRSREHLPQVLGAAVDVAAHVVGVVLLQAGRRQDAAGQDHVPEAGREALDLGLDPLPHVERGAVRDVAVGPGRVPGRGSP